MEYHLVNSPGPERGRGTDDVSTSTAAQDAAKAQRIARRRSQVIASAAKILYETGYHRMVMQAVADDAGTSVGLIYQYFGGKEDVLRAVILDILEDFHRTIPPAMLAAGEDPEARIRAGFTTFCATIDQKREATLLAYRESQTLPDEGRAELMRLETDTISPFRDAVEDGIRLGHFREVSPDLIAHNIKMAAHGWALKHWSLGQTMSLTEYVEAELDLTFAALRPVNE